MKKDRKKSPENEENTNNNQTHHHAWEKNGVGDTEKKNRKNNVLRERRKTQGNHNTHLVQDTRNEKQKEAALIVEQVKKRGTRSPIEKFCTLTTFETLLLLECTFR